MSSLPQRRSISPKNASISSCFDTSHGPTGIASWPGKVATSSRTFSFSRSFGQLNARSAPSRRKAVAIPQGMLRLFPTPMTSAFFPSRRPIGGRIIPDGRARRPRRCPPFAAALLQRIKLRAREPHQIFGIGLVGHAREAQRSESRLLVRADRRRVLHRGSDDARLEMVEGKRDVAEENTKHRRPMAAADEVGLADEEVD